MSSRAPEKEAASLDHILRDLSPQELAGAIEGNIGAQLPLMYAHVPGVQVYDTPELLAVRSDLPITQFNAVYRAVFAPGQVWRKVEETLSLYGSRKGWSVSWHVTPSTQPPDLGTYLEARRFSHVRRVPWMAADLVAAEGPASSSPLAIERVGDLARLRQWVQVAAASFSLSEAAASALHGMFANLGLGPEKPWQLLLGLANGRPVAVCRLFFAAGVAGLHHVGTVPEARRQGYATALTLTSIRMARERGYRIGILFASSLGLPIYRRLGFQVYGHEDIYRWLGSETLPSPADTVNRETIQ